jgi:RNA polymerase sigma factor (sigma-70 family)
MHSLSVADERALLAAARGGGRAEVEALVRYLTPHIQKRAAYEVLRRARGPRPIRREVEDVVHDLWARLFEDDWRVLRAWDPGRGVCLRGFVAMVTTRMVIDLQRSRHATAYLEDTGVDVEGPADPQADPEARVQARHLLAGLVRRLKARLSPAAEAVFDSMYLEGADMEEAVARTGLTKASVYSHRKRISRAALEVAGELMQS